MRICTFISLKTTIIAGLLLAGCGQPTYKDNNGSTMGAAEYVESFDDSLLASDNMNENVIEVQEETTLLAKKDLYGESQPFTIKKGDSLTVLRKEVDHSGKEFVQIYLEDESQSDDGQEIVWIEVGDLSHSSFELVEMEDIFDENGLEIVSGENPSEASVLMGAAKKSKKVKKKKKKKGMTYCYRFVKIRLQKLGLVRGYLPGGSAYMAAKHLPKHGFKRTQRGIQSARVNDVCVYSGGPQGHGHIEMRTAGGWWYGYGVKSKPMSGRRFIACFSKG